MGLALTSASAVLSAATTAIANAKIPSTSAVTRAVGRLVPPLARIPIDPEIARLADSGGIEQYVSPEFEELMANFMSVAPKVLQPA